jgi:hypothetical protein
LRAFDYLRLLFLVRPVRCHICLHRRYANVFAALMLREKPRGQGSGAATAK